MTEDLWPEIKGSATSPPMEILNVQASKLAEKTSHRLEAEVKTSVYGQTIKIDFSIVAPALDHYKYKLFTVSHEAMGYPLRIEGFKLDDSPSRSSVFGLKADGPDQFKDLLRRILNHEDTKNILASLLANTRASSDVRA